MTMTMAPPVVQPSLGLMALIHGVAAQQRKIRVTAGVQHEILTDECSQHYLNCLINDMDSSGFIQHMSALSLISNYIKGFSVSQNMTKPFCYDCD